MNAQVFCPWRLSGMSILKYFSDKCYSTWPMKTPPDGKTSTAIHLRYDDNLKCNASLTTNRYIFSSRGQHSLLSHAPPWECSHHHPWHWWVLLVLVLHTTAIPQPNLAMVIRNTKYKRLLIHSECFILIHVDQTSLNCSMDLMYINVCNIGSATSNTYTYIICFPITSSDRIHCRIL